MIDLLENTSLDLEQFTIMKVKHKHRREMAKEAALNATAKNQTISKTNETRDSHGLDANRKFKNHERFL
jgi:hypothetical protein